MLDQKADQKKVGKERDNARHWMKCLVGWMRIMMANFHNLK